MGGGGALSSVISLIDNTCMWCVWGGRGGGGERGRWKGEMQRVIMKSGHITGSLLIHILPVLVLKIIYLIRKAVCHIFWLLEGAFASKIIPKI